MVTGAAATTGYTAPANASPAMNTGTVNTDNTIKVMK